MDSESDISALAWWAAGWFGSLVRQQRSLSVFRFAPRKIRLAAAGAEEEGGHAAGRLGEVGARLFSMTHAQ